MDLAPLDPHTLRSFDPATATDAKIRQVQEFLGVKPDGDFREKSQAALKVFLDDGPAVQHPVHQDAPPPAPIPAGGAVDVHSEALIAELHPRVQPLARALILAALAAGIIVRIVSAYRSYAQQTALYAQGRTAPGRKVTNAPAGYSNHNFRSAFDLGWFLPDGRYADGLEGKDITTAQLSKTYRQLGAMGKALGLFWGGDWKSIDDEPHFELIPAWAHDMTEGQMLAEFRRRTEAGEDLFA